ncbi:hypothetical protein LA080_001382 [Diaporthe eres]|uniref:Uncharacterized protein n=1 Tax=Diaporthe vaccinii TaxID=105482 RepID=A0ABR4EUG6_9PEZI|nr:hypothetical protein LA080_001382 [Diaporthe eres]
MSNQRGEDLGRPIGELWVELSRDEKKKICDALIDRDQSDVLQHFDTLVRFTRGYLQQQPNDLLQSPNEISSASVPSTAGLQPSDGGSAKRENDEVPVDMSNSPPKKARNAPVRRKSSTSPVPKPRKKMPAKSPESDYVKEENKNDDGF